MDYQTVHNAVNELAQQGMISVDDDISATYITDIIVGDITYKESLYSVVSVLNDNGYLCADELTDAVEAFSNLLF